MCERKPYPVWFLCRHKSYPVLGEHSLRFEKCFLALGNTSVLLTGVEVMVTGVNTLAMSYRRLVGAKKI